MTSIASSGSHAVARKRELRVELELLNADDPARCDPAIIDILRESCGEEELTCMEMVSRAYHELTLHVAARILALCASGLSQ